MITVGVDLAAEAASTAIAVVTWDRGHAHVTDLKVGADDGAVLAALDQADQAALDAPFGWPEPFVEFLLAHRAGRVEAPTGQTGVAWRRTLSRRATDRFVYETTGVTPLSVAADRIAAVAMRAAGILGALDAAGRAVDRAGAGFLVEAYPAAALKCWGLPYKSYKGPNNRLALGVLVDALLAALPQLELSHEHLTLCRHSDDAFDALACALIARATAVGLTRRPGDGLEQLAKHEGWIMLPTSSLDALLSQELVVAATGLPGAPLADHAAS